MRSAVGVTESVAAVVDFVSEVEMDAGGGEEVVLDGAPVEELEWWQLSIGREGL